MARNYVPCLVCDPKMRCEEEIKFLHPNHHEAAHESPLPQDHDSYLTWVAEEYDLDLEHSVFNSGGLTRPEDFEEYEHLFE